MAATGWEEGVPLYQQILARVVAGILDGTWKAGDALPSVRQVASDLCVNPLTVTHAYQQLVAENLVSARRGLGLFVNEGAQAVLRERETTRFWSTEWPRWSERLRQLGLTWTDLLTPPSLEPAP